MLSNKEMAMACIKKYGGINKAASAMKIKAALLQDAAAGFCVPKWAELGIKRTYEKHSLADMAKMCIPAELVKLGTRATFKAIGSGTYQTQAIPVAMRKIIEEKMNNGFSVAGNTYSVNGMMRINLVKGDETITVTGLGNIIASNLDVKPTKEMAMRKVVDVKRKEERPVSEEKGYITVNRDTLLNGAKRNGIDVNKLAIILNCAQK